MFNVWVLFIFACFSDVCSSGIPERPKKSFLYLNQRKKQPSNRKSLEYMTQKFSKTKLHIDFKNISLKEPENFCIKEAHNKKNLVKLFVLLKELDNEGEYIEFNTIEKMIWKEDAFKKVSDLRRILTDLRKANYFKQCSELAEDANSKKMLLQLQRFGLGQIHVDLASHPERSRRFFLATRTADFEEKKAFVLKASSNIFFLEDYVEAFQIVS